MEDIYRGNRLAVRFENSCFRHMSAGGIFLAISNQTLHAQGRPPFSNREAIIFATCRGVLTPNINMRATAGPSTTIAPSVADVGALGTIPSCKISARLSGVHAIPIRCDCCGCYQFNRVQYTQSDADQKQGHTLII